MAIEERVDKLEGDMAMHKHEGAVSAKVDLVKASAVGDLLVGDTSLSYSDFNAGEDDTVLTTDSSEASGLKWNTAFDAPMTMLQQADHGKNNLVVSKLRGLYPAIASDNTRFAERLTIDASDTIEADFGKIRLPGSVTTGSDTNEVLGFITNDLGNPAFDIDGPAEMSCTLKQTYVGSNAVNKTIFIGWGDVGEKPAHDATTWTKIHIGFWGVATTIDGDYTIYASVGNGTTQTTTEIDNSFDINSYTNFRVEVVSGTEVNYYIDGVLEATITTGLPSTNDDSYLPMIHAINESGTASYQSLIIQLNGYFVNTLYT